MIDETKEMLVKISLEKMVEMAHNHPQISAGIWISAALSFIANAYMNSDVSYEEFSRDINRGMSFYKEKWKK